MLYISSTVYLNVGSFFLAKIRNSVGFSNFNLPIYKYHKLLGSSYYPFLKEGLLMVHSNVSSKNSMINYYIGISDKAF